MAGAPIYSGDAVVVTVVAVAVAVVVVAVVVVTISPQHKSDVYTLSPLLQVTLVLGRATGIPRVSC